MSEVPRPFLSTPWDPCWQPEEIGTLLFVQHVHQILLIHKKRGHGAGKVNAPGGKWQRGETLEQCAIRETLEEVGVVVEKAECRAELRFVEQNGPQWLGYAFVATQFSGEPCETDEADPFWCPVSEIPYDQMWPDDEIWLPQILNMNPAINEDVDKDTRLQPLVGDFLFSDGLLLDYSFTDAISSHKMLDEQNLGD